MASTLGSTIFAQRTSLRFLVILGLVAVTVAILGVVSHRMVRNEVRHLVEVNLTGTRQLIATVAHAWANNQVRIAERTASRPQLQKDLAAGLAGDGEARRRTVETLDGIAASAQVAWWALVDGQGTVVLAPQAAQIGRRLPAEAPVAEVLAGGGRFSPAMRLDGVGLDLVAFLACCRMPVTGGTPLALVLAHDPAGVFNHFVTQSYGGESMESYAFDEQGRMLTSSRFLEQLKAAGRLPADATTTIFRLELRDPTAPGSDPANPRSWPLTRMAAAAAAGKSGVELDGYRDYRGEDAVAAWT